MEALWQTMRAGGPVVFVLAALSFVSLALIALKALELRHALPRGAAPGPALALWAEGRREEALARAEAGRAPADRIALAAMRGILAGRGAAALDAELEWKANAEIAALGRHVRLLEIIGMVAPLLGLLGTVLGMIGAFRELSLAGGAANASLLAGGIWQALLTTAAGLIVAIPATVAAGLFTTRIDAAAQRMEEVAGRLLTLREPEGAGATAGAMSGLPPRGAVPAA